MDKIHIRTIALIDPMGDYGIGGYTYELAEGLAANGVEVSLYTSDTGTMARLPLPRRHRLLPVLGSFIFRQRHAFNGTGSNVQTEAAATALPSSATRRDEKPWRLRRTLAKTRNFLIPLELALHLRRSGYDLVWTQWPARDYGIRFWKACQVLGLRLAHTVHDILPHEWPPETQKLCGAIYRMSDLLIVHSHQVKEELAAQFPGTGDKTLVSPHGIYTMFTRQLGARQKIRKQLNIGESQPVLLFFGSVRPYKNIDAVLQSLGSDAFPDVILIVCGTEYYYSDVVPGDPLGRTRRLVEKLGLESQVRLIPRRTDLKETAELFEAADVLVLPYLKTYGSGVLLLGMTFGKYVVATNVGGFPEYLQGYTGSVLLQGPEAFQVQDGLREALRRLRVNAEVASPALERLRWPHIARKILAELESRL